MSFHGLVLIDKPVGWTSHDVVAKARRLLQTKKIGHAGTLDPLASGLLILLVGHATKLSDFLLNGKKSYRVTAQLGVETDSLDMTGEVLRTQAVNLQAGQVKEVIAQLQGELNLPVPKYSAVKVDGRRLYKYARQNQEVAEVYRLSTFERVEFLEFSGEQVEAHLTCSKGAFVRAWVAEMGKRLGCGAAVKELRRTESSPYDIKATVTLEALEKALEDGSWRNLEAVISLEKTLPHWLPLEASAEEESLLMNGAISPDLQSRSLPLLAKSGGFGGVKILSAKDGHLLALVEEKPGGGCQIRRVFSRGQ